MTELTDFLIEEKKPLITKEEEAIVQEPEEVVEEEKAIVQEPEEIKEAIEEQTLSSFLSKEAKEVPQDIEQEGDSIRTSVLKGIFGETAGGILEFSPSKLAQKQFEVAGDIGSGIRAASIEILQDVINIGLKGIEVIPDFIKESQLGLLSVISATDVKEVDLFSFSGGGKITLNDGTELDFGKPAEDVSTVEEVTSLITQLAIPGLGFTKILKGAGVADKIGSVLTKWGVNGRTSVVFADLVNAELGFSVASQLVFDGNDPRLSNLIQQNPEFANAAVIGPLTEFLQADPNDSVLVGRTKLALEDALIGLGFGIGLSIITELAPKIIPKIMTRVTGKLTPEQEGFQEYLRTETKFYETEVVLDEASSLASKADKGFDTLPIVEQEKIIAEVLTTNPNLSETSKGFLASFKEGEELLFTADDVLRLRREADANDQFFAFKASELTELEEIEISTLARQALDKMDESIAGPKTLVEKTKELTERVLKEKRQFIQNMFDLYRPAKRQQEVVTGLQASIAGLKKATEKVAAGGVIEGSVGSPSTLPYYSFRLLAATPQRVEDILLKGVSLPPEVGAKIARFEITGNKGLDQILEPFEKTEQLDSFLKFIAVQKAVRLAAKDDPVILPFLEQAETIINAFKRNKSFIKGQKELTQYTDDLLEYAKRSGLLDEATIKAFKDINPDAYIPTYRIIKNIEGVKKVRGSGTPFKRIVGGEEPINDLLDNLRRLTYSIVNASDLNRTRIAYFKFIEDAQAKGILSGVVKRLGNKQAVESFGSFTKDVLNELEKRGLHIDVGDNDISSILNVMGFSSRIKTKSGTLVEFAREDGKLVAFEILDEDTALMFGAMGPKFSQSALLKPFSRISGLFGAAITRDPRFFTFNIIRDTISSPINSEFGFIPIYSTLKGLKDIYSDQELFREAIVNGLGFSTRVITEGADVSLLKSSSKLLKTSYGRTMFSMVEKIGLKFALNTVKGYTKFVDSLELAGRISEFQLAKKAGLDSVGAAFAGREIATDFGNRGASDLLRSYSRYTVFLNAGLQGAYRAGRRIKENPKKLLGSLMVLSSFDLGLHVNNLNFKEYQQLDDRVKELNYLFPNFKEEGAALEWLRSGLDPEFLPELDEELPFIPVPKPFDYGQVGTFTIGLYDMVRTGNPSYGPQAITNFIQNVMPIRETMVPQAPTAIQPLLDLLINKNFRGKEITPIYMKSLEKTQQYFSSTSETAIAASRRLRDTFGFNDSPLSPLEIDFLLNGYMPGLFQIPKTMLETKVRQKVGAPDRPRERKLQEIVRLDPESFAGPLRDTPLEPIAVGTVNFARRFAGRFASVNLDKQNAHINRLYEIKREADKIVASREKAISDVSRLMRLKRELDINGEDFSSVFSERDQQFLRTQTVFSDFSATLLAGNELIRVIKETEDMSPDQKRLQIDQIQSQNREIAFQLIKQLQEMRSLDELFSGPFGVKKDTGENPLFEQVQKLLKKKE